MEQFGTLELITHFRRVKRVKSGISTIVYHMSFCYRSCFLFIVLVSFSGSLSFLVFDDDAIELRGVRILVDFSIVKSELG